MAGLEDKFGALTLDGGRKPDVYLDVHGLGSSATRATFQNQNCIGKFKITKEKTFTMANVEIPRLIPRQKFQSIRGTYLGTAYEQAELIQDYSTYHILKQEFFLRWIVDNNFFRGVNDKKYKKPEFVSFGGRITDPLMTPWVERYGDWEIFAARVHDTIYLWDEKSPDEKRTKESYYGIYFEHLLTQENAKASVPNEFDKVYVVNEITFGSHQLLCLNEIDAVDETDNWVEIKVFKKCSPKGMSAKHLKYWAQSIVPGLSKLVLGERDASGILKSVDVTTVDAVAGRASWNPSRCYEFQDRLLTWIKSHFKDNNPNKVKKFSWKCGTSRITSSDVLVKNIPKDMFPKWYLEDAQLKTLFP